MSPHLLRQHYVDELAAAARARRFFAALLGITVALGAGA